MILVHSTFNHNIVKKGSTLLNYYTAIYDCTLQQGKQLGQSKNHSL